MTIKEILRNASEKLKEKGIKSAELDAEIILSYVLKKPKVWLFANSEKQVSFSNSQEYKNRISRRLKFEPVAYIIGKKEFYGLDWNVDKNVLIPRPETEILVNALLNEISKCYKKKRTPKSVANNKMYNPDNYQITDIGTGSGCVAISLAKLLKIENCKLKIFASDISKKALKVAKENAQKYKVQNKIKFIKSDLFENINKNLKFDIIIANLPYLNKKILSQNLELKYEPINALDGGKNGLELYEKFFKQIKNHLKPNAKIFIEIDPKQTKKIKEIINKELFKSHIKIIKDLNNFNRIVIVYTHPKSN